MDDFDTPIWQLTSQRRSVSANPTDCQEWTDAQPRDLPSSDEMPAKRQRRATASPQPAQVLESEVSDSEEVCESEMSKPHHTYVSKPPEVARGKASAVKLATLYTAKQQMETEIQQVESKMQQVKSKMQQVESKIIQAEEEVVAEGFEGEFSMAGLFWWGVDEYLPGAPSVHNLCT